MSQRQDTRLISQEEMVRRFAELRAITKDGPETASTVAQKWEERKGKSVTVGMVQTYYRKVRDLDKHHVDLHEAAKEKTWSEIIWPREDRK